MSQNKFCPKCGTQLLLEDRFCDECGYDFADNASIKEEERPVSHKNLVIIIAISLVVLLLGGGGLYWWLSSPNRGGGNSGDLKDQEMPELEELAELTEIPELLEWDSMDPMDPVESDVPEVEEVPIEAEMPQGHLSQASTYLSENGLKCTFEVNYAHGGSMMMDRISGLGSSQEAIKISETELMVIEGEEYGNTMHYTQEADGTYHRSDGFDNLLPVLKNGLSPGKSWEHSDSFGSIIWTVVEIGADLDLGFHQFRDCLLVEKDDQVGGFQSVTYYAPGYGSVYVTFEGGEIEDYKMTAMTKIDEAEAASVINKWSSN